MGLVFPKIIWRQHQPQVKVLDLALSLTDWEGKEGEEKNCAFIFKLVIKW